MRWTGGLPESGRLSGRLRDGNRHAASVTFIACQEIWFLPNSESCGYFQAARLGIHGSDGVGFTGHGKNICSHYIGPFFRIFLLLVQLEAVV